MPAAPNGVRIRTRPSQLAVPIKNWPDAAHRHLREVPHREPAVEPQVPARDFDPPARRTERPQLVRDTHRATDVVPIAAPVTPSSGNGPSPKMRQGSSTTLTVLASHSERIAIVASPAPRKTALIRNSSMIEALPPSIQAV